MKHWAELCEMDRVSTPSRWTPRCQDVTGAFVLPRFRTLFSFPAASKTPVGYEAGREVDAFIEGIAKHATNELKGCTRGGQRREENSGQVASRTWSSLSSPWSFSSRFSYTATHPSNLPHCRRILSSFSSSSQ